MTSSRQKARTQPQITSAPNEELCLDTIQLNKLELSYRKWVQTAARSDVHQSRKRILLIFLLIRYTGAKLNEVLSINLFQDIDFDGHRVVLTSKRTKSSSTLRTVPLPDALAQEIKIMISDPAFADTLKETLSVDPGFVRRKFYERSEASGFDKKKGAPEMIRKARAVEMLQCNMPLPAVQSLLGHSTPNLTKSLVSFSEDEMQRLTHLFMERESNRKTSARNSFFGKVTAIEKGEIMSRIEMITLDGFTVITTITNHSLDQLGLKKGKLVTAEVKAPWVIVQKSETDSLRCTAENRFQGVITRVTTGKINTELVVRISETTELCTIITTKSFRQVNLKKDEQVSALFNSFAVVIHAG